MFGQMWEMKKMYDKYKKLQDALQSIIIRAKDVSSYEWKDLGIMIDISGDTKVKDVQIHDPENIIPESVRKHLEKSIKVSFEKGQQKSQEVAQEKTKEILGFDPTQLAWMMWGGNMPNIPGLG